MTTERFNVSMVKNIGPMTTDLRVVSRVSGKIRNCMIVVLWHFRQLICWCLKGVLMELRWKCEYCYEI